MHHDEESAHEILDALSYIDPACLSYQEWIDVGFALHESGLACSIWDEWSAKDAHAITRGNARENGNRLDVGKARM